METTSAPVIPKGTLASPFQGDYVIPMTFFFQTGWWCAEFPPLSCHGAQSKLSFSWDKISSSLRSFWGWTCLVECPPLCEECELVTTNSSASVHCTACTVPDAGYDSNEHCQREYLVMHTRVIPSSPLVRVVDIVFFRLVRKKLWFCLLLLARSHKQSPLLRHLLSVRALCNLN